MICLFSFVPTADFAKGVPSTFAAAIRPQLDHRQPIDRGNLSEERKAHLRGKRFRAEKKSKNTLEKLGNDARVIARPANSQLNSTLTKKRSAVIRSVCQPAWCQFSTW
jgi:hypothetical protein